MITAPNNTRVIIRGISQYFLRSFRYPHRSLSNSNEFPIMNLLPLLLTDHNNLVFVNAISNYTKNIPMHFYAAQQQIASHQQ